MSNENKLNSIILVRAFTIIIVVIGHSIIVYSKGWDIFTPHIESYIFHYIKEYINTFQMPLFTFISGYTYYYNRVELKKYDSKKTFISDKFKRLYLPYIIVATFYLIPIRILIRYQGYDKKSLLQIFIQNVLLTKDIGHLWYIIALLWIFVIFRTIENKIIQGNLKLNFIIIFLASIIGNLLPDFLNLTNAIYLFVFFILGYIVRQIEKKKEVPNNFFIIFFLFMIHIGLFLLYLYLSSINNSLLIRTIFITVGSLCGIFGTLFYFSIIALITEKRPKIVVNKVVELLNRESFSIYLFHSPIIYIVLHLTIDKINHPLILVSVCFIISLIGSLTLSSIIRIMGLNCIIGKRNKSRI